MLCVSPQVYAILLQQFPQTKTCALKVGPQGQSVPTKSCFLGQASWSTGDSAVLCFLWTLDSQTLWGRSVLLSSSFSVLAPCLRDKGRKQEVMSLSGPGLSYFPVSLYFLRFYLFIFREVKGQRKREKHQSVASCVLPNRTPNPQPRHVP